MILKVRRAILLTSGLMLAVLGVIHLAVTPLIVRLLKQGLSPDVVAWLTPPMILNHVVVGILLLPLGILTIYAASEAASGEYPDSAQRQNAAWR